MSYKIVQFEPSEGGTVEIVLAKWFTPEKTQLFWPPTKDPKAYNKLLQESTSPDPEQGWMLYGVERVFYQTDHLDKAKKKLKLVEVQSDIQTAGEETDTNKTKPRKRKITKNRHFSTDEDDDECSLLRPPPLRKSFTSDCHSSSSSNSVKLHGSQMPHSVDEHLLENSPSQSDTSGHCSQDKVVSLLAHIKAQNSVILSILQDRDNHMKPQTLKPEFKFPVESLQELEKVEQLLTVDENYTNVVAYFKSLGGQGINNKVSRAMKAALSESMASKFNFYGKRSDKKPFAELRLRASVVESLKSESITEKNIEDSIKVWLKHAPERAKKALNKTQ